MVEIGGLLCFAGYLAIGLAVLLIIFYFYIKRRGPEKELEEKMKKAPKDNV
jgi:hypothetical protein